MRHMILAAAVLALTAPSAAAAAHDAAPQLAATSFNALPQPLPFPYDEHANAPKVVAAAEARARQEHKRLLIDLGGNWCLDCRLLAATMDLPQMRSWMARHFVVVTVDVGRFDRNLSIPAHYGIRHRLAGVPSVLIVDPATDRLVNQKGIAALADARSMTPQALADWLAQWTA